MTHHLPEPQVFVGIISYNGAKVIDDCIQSIQSQSYRNFSLCMIDNASTDGTPERVKQQYCDLEVWRYPKNLGPSPARNLALKKSPSDLVLLVDDDAVLHPDCLKELVAAYHQYPQAAIWAPRIVYFDQKNIIQFEGTKIHYLAEAILLNPDTPVNEGIHDIQLIQVAGGVCFLVSKQAAAKIQYFDEDYFFGRTDGEFTFRITQAGYQIYTVPNAICYHKVKNRGLSKVFYQIRNRWYFILASYSWKTILLLIPPFILYELFLIAFLTLKGRLMEYFRAMRAVAGNMPIILEKRQRIQAARQVRDCDLLHSGEINMRKDLVKSPFISLTKKVINSMFNAYWKMVYPFIP